jgi:DNA helicase II / ATP-dependent DNA helicase PcrA
MTDLVDDNHLDDGADTAIHACINIGNPKSFFLYAGAGSGKTRSLVEAIRNACREQGRQLFLSGQQIAVITYTNAACDEIKQRLEFDSLVDVRTVHSFAWNLVEGYNDDIRTWVANNLLTEIADLESLQARGRGGKASADRARSIESKRNRYTNLSGIQRFIYSPTGQNLTRDSLNHAEVIAMTAEFLMTKPGLQRLLISQFPILLIDESQDTNKRLMDAFLYVQVQHASSFCLGLFGDTMQRIYADGKVDLIDAIPKTWAMPIKQMNHRCPARVMALINKIRADDDGQLQRGRSDKPGGYARLFIMADSTADKFEAESRVAERMSQITGDANWTVGDDMVKTLTLEHHMAARRLGFHEFFEPLYAVDRLRTSLLDGSLPGITFFTRNVLPVTKALGEGDRFRAAACIKLNSPLLEYARLEAAGESQAELIRTAKEAAEALQAVHSKASGATLLEILRNIAETGLFSIPDSLTPFARSDEQMTSDDSAVNDVDDEKSELVAWRRALQTPFIQIEKYDRYVRGVSKFGTHQGVKGLEFPRVMVVISDDEARGFLFSYEKLFGAKDKSKTDHENEATGKETTIDRTRRLFYVICSRAEESLAIVYYSSAPALVKRAVVERGWFKDEEVELVL